MVQRSHTHEDVTILEDPIIMIAKQELPPLALRIIPRAADLRLPAEVNASEFLKLGGDACADITANISRAQGLVQYTRVSVDLSHALGRQRGSSLIIDPFEFIDASSQAANAYAGGCAELERVVSGVLSVPFSEYATTDANLRQCKKAVSRLECRVSYWTNAANVPMGSVVALPPFLGPLLADVD